MLSALRTSRSLRLTPHHIAGLSRRAYASVTDLNSLPKPGDRIHGFTLQKARHVPELELSALHFQHDKTGADYLHVARDDENNVFSIGFKTNPPDATGVPHILEHVTLCSSEKYPIRDPFFKMLPRSLHNFMNAFTSLDHTMYPIATTNSKDFRNLMTMYLDSTLHPLLKKSDFIQEGWRVGPENPAAPADAAGKDLVFKGVVYNEMKGQFSDATYFYYMRWMQEIAPSLNFFGGEPQKITDLTYEQLRNFHQQHYHPSNSKILTYGNTPVEEHLAIVGRELNRFTKIAVNDENKLPISLANGSRDVVAEGPLDQMTAPDAQNRTSVAWIMGDTSNIQESFALNIATSLLTDGYGSPMYRALIESGLGSDFSPNTGYDSHTAKAIFALGLNGVTDENLPKVKKTIFATIKESIANGFEKQKVNGMLHQLELSLKHKTAKFGIGLVQNVQGQWFTGKDPFDALQWNSIVQKFKSDFAKPRYLEDLLAKYLLPDRTLTYTMRPSKSYSEELAAEEQSRLAAKIEAETAQHGSAEAAYEHLRKQELDLVEEQDAGRTQSVDCLPMLSTKDIPRKQKNIAIRDSAIAHAKVQWHEAPTNELTYFRGIAKLNDLPDELRMLVPLFCDALMRIGTRNKSMEELEDLIKLKTGGVSIGYHVSGSPQDLQTAHEGLMLRGSAFDRNVSAMYELLQILLLETDFDSPKAHKMIRELLQSGASGAVDAVAGSGHMYASMYANAGFGPSGRLAEQTGGLTQVKLIAQLASAEENADAMTSLIKQLQAIQALASASLKSSFRVALTCGSSATSANESALQSFLTSTSSAALPTPTLSTSSATASSISTSSRTHFTLPYQVSYAALALPTAPYTSTPTQAANSILAALLTHKHLHHEIREKGGAYGAFASSRPLSGTFTLSSYRDPNPENSLKIMTESAKWALDRQWSEQELEEAKLSVFQGVDAPVSVSAEGMVRFEAGISREMEQERREALLDVQASDVRSAAEGLAGKLERGEGRTVVLGPRKGFVKEEEGWRIEDMARELGLGGTAAV
ncbi:Mitochondrial presequence protease [Oleoguttula sp. CCFEE 5521]